MESATVKSYFSKIFQNLLQSKFCSKNAMFAILLCLILCFRNICAIMFCLFLFGVKVFGDIFAILFCKKNNRHAPPRTRKIS